MTGNDIQITSVQSLSHVHVFATPWSAGCQDSLSITSSCSLLSFMSIESVMPYNHLSPSVFPFSSCLQSFPASGFFPMSQFFASGGQSIGVWSFSISSSKAYSGLIFFRIDWFDLLAVQGALKSLLQHRSSKASTQARKIKTITVY